MVAICVRNCGERRKRERERERVEEGHGDFKIILCGWLKLPRKSENN